VEGLEIGAGECMADNADATLRAYENSPVPVVSICGNPSFDFLDPSREKRRRSMDECRQVLSVAGKLGAVGQIVPPIFGPPRLPDLSPLEDAITLEKRLLVELVKELGDAAASAGTKLLLEPLNRYEQHLLRRQADGVEIIERAGNPPAVALISDFFHMHIEETDTPAALRAAGRHVAHVHLADNTRMEPGTGDIDFVAGFRRSGRSASPDTWPTSAGSRGATPPRGGVAGQEFGVRPRLHRAGGDRGSVAGNRVEGACRAPGARHIRRRRRCVRTGRRPGHRAPVRAAAEWYGHATDHLRHGRWFERAIRQLKEATRQEPGNPDYQLALGCAYASRAAAIAEAAEKLENFAWETQQFAKKRAAWEAAQRDPASPTYGKPGPASPPPLVTRDDNQPFRWTKEEAPQRARDLARAATDTLDKGVALARSAGAADEAKAESVRGGRFSSSLAMR
jgi:sugar phosphate isomerase/epimerase